MSDTGILWQSSGEDSASTAGGMGLIPDLGTKILHATHHGQKKKKCCCCYVASVMSDSV